MSSESLPRQRRSRGPGWWIAGGVIALLLALSALLFVGLALYWEPIKMSYGFVSGNPALPDCSTTVTREATDGPLWYRVVELACPKESMHFVYFKRGTGPGLFVLPAFFSVGSPVPVSVRQTADNGFEVLLSKPLADGRDAVLLDSNQNGMPETKMFDHGKETKSLAH